MLNHLAGKKIDPTMNIGGRSNYQARNITGPSGSPLKGVLHEPVKKKSTIKIIKPKVEEEPTEKHLGNFTGTIGMGVIKTQNYTIVLDKQSQANFKKGAQVQFELYHLIDGDNSTLIARDLKLSRRFAGFLSYRPNGPSWIVPLFSGRNVSVSKDSFESEEDSLKLYQNIKVDYEVVDNKGQHRAINISFPKK